MNEGMRFTRQTPSRETRISREIFEMNLHVGSSWLSAVQPAPWLVREGMRQPMKLRESRQRRSVSKTERCKYEYTILLHIYYISCLFMQNYVYIFMCYVYDTTSTIILFIFTQP